MTDIHKDRLASLLAGAAKLFPDFEMPFRLEPFRLWALLDGSTYQLYRVIDATGNCCAVTWIDPADELPVYKPSGSTPTNADKKGSAF